MSSGKELSLTKFPVEVRERYEAVMTPRWPVIVSPLMDELLSSWLHRMAFANGTTLRSLSETLNLPSGMWLARTDITLPPGLVSLLAERTGVDRQAIAQISSGNSPVKALSLPLRQNCSRPSSTWIQYCPNCLASDEAPYFRGAWRLATRVSCYIHAKGLRDRCPSCRRGVASFGQQLVSPHHICAVCGFDLRQSPRISITLAARWLEHLIDRELASNKGAPDHALIYRLRHLPRRSGQPESLPSLPSRARIRCFEHVAEEHYERFDELVAFS